MPTALGPRFVLEAGFLVLLAVVVGLADLDPLLIVLVMLVGWILVSLLEYFAWRQSQAVMMRGFEPAFAGPAVNDMAVDEAPPPPPPPPAPPPAPPPEEETAVTPLEAEEPPDEKAEEGAEEEEQQQEEEEEAPASEEPAPAEANEESGFTKPEERQVGHRLEPLRPRPRRRWIFFGPHERPEDTAEDDSEA